MLAAHTDYVWTLCTLPINKICDNVHIQFHCCINCINFQHEFQWFILLYFYRDFTPDNLGHIMVFLCKKQCTFVIRECGNRNYSGQTVVRIF